MKGAIKYFAGLFLRLVAATLLLGLFGGVALMAQTTVEGQLFRDKTNKKDNHPAVNVPVTLYSQTLGRSPVVYTDSEGKFYLKNVPPGKYDIQIWKGSSPNDKGPGSIYPIEVSEGQKNKVVPLLVK